MCKACIYFTTKCNNDDIDNNKSEKLVEITFKEMNIKLKDYLSQDDDELIKTNDLKSKRSVSECENVVGNQLNEKKDKNVSLNIEKRIIFNEDEDQEEEELEEDVLEEEEEEEVINTTKYKDNSIDYSNDEQNDESQINKCINEIIKKIEIINESIENNKRYLPSQSFIKIKNNFDINFNFDSKNFVLDKV